ncbi:hypothetical protein [Methanosarcina barkeri]|nr:hypothetical protein [Methanosarcina barkeri]
MSRTISPGIISTETGSRYSSWSLLYAASAAGVTPGYGFLFS